MRVTRSDVARLVRSSISNLSMSLDKLRKASDLKRLPLKACLLQAEKVWSSFEPTSYSLFTCLLRKALKSFLTAFCFLMQKPLAFKVITFISCSVYNTPFILKEYSFRTSSAIKNLFYKSKFNLKKYMDEMRSLIKNNKSSSKSIKNTHIEALETKNMQLNLNEINSFDEINLKEERKSYLQDDSIRHNEKNDCIATISVESKGFELDLPLIKDSPNPEFESLDKVAETCLRKEILFDHAEIAVLNLQKFDLISSNAVKKTVLVRRSNPKTEKQLRKKAEKAERKRLICELKLQKLKNKSS